MLGFGYISLWYPLLYSLLSLSAHVATLCRTGFFYHLRQLRPMPRSLTHEAATTLSLSRRSYPVAWITATHCSLVCPTILSGEFCPSRTPLLGFSLEPDDAIISRFLRQLHWLPVQRRVDYIRVLACFVFSSLSGHAPPYLADGFKSLKVIDGGYALPPTDRVPFHAHTTHSATGEGESLSPGHVFRTVFQPTCATRTLHTTVSDVNSNSGAQCDFCQCAIYINTLTYSMPNLNLNRLCFTEIWQYNNFQDESHPIF